MSFAVFRVNTFLEQPLCQSIQRRGRLELKNTSLARVTSSLNEDFSLVNLKISHCLTNYIKLRQYNKKFTSVKKDQYDKIDSVIYCNT